MFMGLPVVGVLAATRHAERAPGLVWHMREIVTGYLSRRRGLRRFQWYSLSGTRSCLVQSDILDPHNILAQQDVSLPHLLVIHTHGPCFLTTDSSKHRNYRRALLTR